jgi:hypothetical protein
VAAGERFASKLAPTGGFERGGGLFWVVALVVVGCLVDVMA